MSAAEAELPAGERKKKSITGRPAIYPQRERHMAQHLRGASKAKRIERAMQRYFEEGLTQVEVARWAGVSPGTINRRSQEMKRDQLAADQRSREAKVALAASDDGPTVEVSGEARRVPPIGEFVRTYFDGFKCWNCVDRSGEPMRHEIPLFHDEIMESMTDRRVKRALYNLPPEHSKTTNGTVFTSVYDIVRDPNIQMGIVSAGEALAADIVGQMQTLLEDRSIYDDSTKNLIDDFGPFNAGGVTWTRKEFIIAGRRSVERDPTVRAFGINSKIYGRRIHRLILDDVADEDNNDTVEKVTKMFRKITSTLDSRVGGNGRLHIVGTRVNPADVYKMLGELSGYRVYRHPCIIDYDAELTLWPEHIDFSEAMKRKSRTTPEMFELIYQNSDTMGEGGNFTRAHLDRCHDESRVIGQLPKGVLLDLVIGVDPAGHGKQAGFTAMILLGIDRLTGTRYLIDLVNVRSMTQPQMQAQVFDWVNRYRVRSFRFESVALQSQIFETQEWRNGLTAAGVRMDRHSTNSKGGVAGKHDMNWGVETMSTSFHNAMVNLPWADGRSKRAVGELEEQLMRFPMEGAPTDLMMAYWIADTGCRLIFERGASRKFQERGYSEPPPPAMLRNRRVWSRGVARTVSGRDFGLRRESAGVPMVLANMEADVEELLDAGS
jgi:hypothetical protein